MREQWIESAVCALLAVVSLAIAAWTLLTGQVSAQGVDGLFLILVCLLLAAAFSIPPLQAVREGLLEDFFRARKKEKTPQSEPAEMAARNSSEST